jgi:hypothetical protein
LAVTGGRRLRVLAVLVLAATSASARRAPAADSPPEPRLPFSDDVAAPPPLPQPIDRAFKGELVEFDGDRATLRWDWKSDEQLADFESFVPVRASLRGGFAVRDGRVAADGTAGIRVKLGFLSDFEVHVGPSTLRNPHDLGIVLPTPGSSDDSILCLVQDVLFTRFDGAAGNTNMINKLGGITSASLGMTEFRYVARSIEPRIAANADVAFDVVRKGPETAFTISPKGGDATTLRGKDVDAPYTRFTPGLYVSGGTADFGKLTIGGKLDPAWCADHGVLPYVAANLLHPGNRWKPPERRLAEMVEHYAKDDQAGEKDPKKVVAVEQIAPIVGDVKAPLVIRIRAAEAMMDRGEAGAVADRLATLLDSRDEPARVLAWQLLRKRLPWHFHYEVDADPKARREAAQLIGAYLRDHEEMEAAGKVFVEGFWYTPERADDICGLWEHAWDLRTRHVRLRTDLPRKWADWYLAALEAEYRELVRLVGREPPAANLPLSVLVLKDAAGFAAFCKANGYESKATWGRFVDLDRNVSVVAFDKKDGLANTLGQVAKQFHRFATGKFWPKWYDEGRASWFGSADYQTVSFDGTTLKCGLKAQGQSIRLLAKAAADDKLRPIGDLVARDPRDLSGEERRLWYAEAWALHAWLVDVAPEAIREKFARWTSDMEKTPATPRDVDDVGFKLFMAYFAKEREQMDLDFRDWVKTL